MKKALAGRSSTRNAERGRYEIEQGASPRVAESVPVGLASDARVISATEAARNFSDLINRVSYKGETYTVERGGRPMCQLVPVESRGCTGAELLDVLSSLPRPSDAFLTIVEELARDQAIVEPSAWEK